MKRIIQIKLLPTEEQVQALGATMLQFNKACNWVAEKAFERKLANSYTLQKLYYYEVREQFNLPANIAILIFAQVAANYKRDKSKQISFRPLAAIPYRRGAFRYKGLEFLNIKTADEKRHDIPMVMGNYQAEQFGNVKLFAELVKRKDGKWFLMAVVETDDLPPLDTDDFLGVDLGVNNLATDSDGTIHSGKDVEQVRLKCQTLKQQLQSKADLAKNTKGRKNIRKLLKRKAQRESNFRRNTNHIISKRIVEKAKGTLKGIALENLKGIRQRTQFRKLQRNKMGSWGFDQLKKFIAYKAQQIGVMVKLVDPKYTSQMCSSCKHIEKSNRLENKFHCKKCDFKLHADYNAALNIMNRAKNVLRASVNKPIVPTTPISLAAG